jgi:hypothetical protein
MTKVLAAGVVVLGLALLCALVLVIGLTSEHSRLYECARKAEAENATLREKLRQADEYKARQQEFYTKYWVWRSRVEAANPPQWPAVPERP